MPELARRHAVKAGVAVSATAAAAGPGLLSERAQGAVADPAIFRTYVASTLGTSRPSAPAMPCSGVLSTRAELCKAVRRSGRSSIPSVSPQTTAVFHLSPRILSEMASY